MNKRDNLSGNIYQDFFRVYGFYDYNIDTVFNIANSKIKKEIDIIVCKHEILLHYKLTGEVKRFDKYSTNDFVLDYNMEIFLYALIEVFTILPVHPITTKFKDSVKNYIYQNRIWKADLYKQIQRM